MVAIDGNAWTEDVWTFARRYPSSKLIMVRGRGDDGAPRLARVRREHNERTGVPLKYSKRFFNFGASILKMSLYRDLAKDDPLAPGFIFFPRGLEDEYFRQLCAERREPIKRHGFTVFRWTKPERQANEALDTCLQATAAAIRAGVYGLSDLAWNELEAKRESPLQPDQADLEDFIGVVPQPARPPAQSPPHPLILPSGQKWL
jgi:phage terminase large subunit GpA-like protein